MLRLASSSFLLTAALLLPLLGTVSASAAPFNGVLYGKKYNKTSCPAMALPDSETAPTYVYRIVLAGPQAQGAGGNFLLRSGPPGDRDAPLR